MGSKVCFEWRETLAEDGGVQTEVQRLRKVMSALPEVERDEPENEEIKGDEYGV